MWTSYPARACAPARGSLADCARHAAAHPGYLARISPPDRDTLSVSLTTGGITLLGVLASVGTTVGFGISGPWYLRAAAGIATTLLLTALVKLGTSAGRGPLARAANWMIGPRELDEPERR